MVPIPLPAQLPVTDGFVNLPDAKLWYWDTGGSGPPVIMHAGSAPRAIGYQQPVLQQRVAA